ncbi:PREDICTED: cytokinin dehydrogenase 4-like [Camelina sativa]|uniref:cytokinin dehydrogenase n=1 Tax=Camelina sativa TaxID=90675 RepID=A0ABM0UAE1_CAMSA|nr:PREDICTED: cytokinin dehydrogenase 4-like [Camelina sativa]
MTTNLGLSIITLITLFISLTPTLTKSEEGIDVFLPITLNLTVLTDPFSISAASHDFGNITDESPGAVLCPSSPTEVARLLGFANGGFSYNGVSTIPEPTFKVAARGQGHSLRGQASAPGGIVVNMTCLAMAAKPAAVVISADGTYADVAAGTMWVDVLKAAVERGVSPVTWTDYLYLSVGGTLSNAGIGGQTFRHGPQISNVHELDVITGKGEMMSCSPKLNPELFYGVLGGLGQFGIITRARIALGHAPTRVKWSRILYSDFSAFKRDQERLISMTNDLGVDFLEGQLMMSNGIVDTSFFPLSDQTRVASLVNDHRIIYVLEVAKCYDSKTLPITDLVMDMLSRTLGFAPGFMFIQDVPYFDFLNRVRNEEEKLRSLGLWEVPHPWLNIFVPKSRILDFHDGVIHGLLLNQTATAGVTLFYPTNRNKWNNRMSTMSPDEDVFYVIGLLQSAGGSQNWQELENLNDKIIQFCENSGIKIKEYLMHYTRKEDWIKHFGPKWDDFLRRKIMFDPKRLLSPGQDIFN